jgi:glucose-1-phosphate thymidylyltransferase
MIGILMAGGSGTRLYPTTKSVSKHFFPIYDKPMIYYSLSLFFLAKIRQILIITDEKSLNLYEDLLGDGSNFGATFIYIVQDKPNGIAEGIKISEKYIQNKKICLVLGDNILYGNSLIKTLINAKQIKNGGAEIFGYFVKNPAIYGVIEFNKNNTIKNIHEKPKKFFSNYAVPGIYFYDENAINFVKTMKPSSRGELEITELNKIYLKQNKLKVNILNRGFAWLDTGTNENLINASNFVYSIEKRQGLKIACIEEIAYHNKWINSNELRKLINKNNFKSDYADYLKYLLK